MKKIMLLCVLPATVLAFACSDDNSGSTQPPDQLLQTSFNEYLALLNDPATESCADLATPAPQFCSCPNGGTITKVLQGGGSNNLDLTFSDCVGDSISSDFNGIFVANPDSQPDISGAFSRFGECGTINPFTLNISGDACDGSFTATCGGQTGTCTLAGGPPLEDCTATCTF